MNLFRPLFALSILALSASWVYGQAQILSVHEGLPDLDSRTESIAPTSAQLSQVSALGATASWNKFGTPQSLIKYGGHLATGVSGDPVTAARSWIRANRSLFRLSDAGVDSLELVNDSRMAGYDGHAVIFRQRFGDLAATEDGMVTVGIAGGNITYVSSSLAGDQVLAGEPVLTPSAAWLVAAVDVGRTLGAADILDETSENDWTVFKVSGLSHPGRARLTAFPTPGGVRPAFETILLDVNGGHSTAYKHFIDAETGNVLFRQNAVYNAADTQTFTGSYQDDPAPKACGPFHAFSVPAGTTAIDVVATEAVIGNDIVLNLYFGTASLVASSDTATSPEAIHYAPAALAPGVYNVQVCPFATPTVPPTPPYNYAGTFTISDVATPSTFPYPPKWNVFPANPPLDLSATDTRELWCWESTVGGTPVPGCDRSVRNLAARAPWDHDVKLNVPTFTTKGNAALTGEAWGSPLTPAEQYRPVSPARDYNFDWSNAWKQNRCAPTVLTPQGNDIDAAVTNLFVMHNRMHDWAYRLGFTEQNFNSQENNFGNTAPGPFPLGRENDPQIGNSQAGALTGGAPSYLGRDNANQITLNDGISPISNMYLWQPIAGRFYAPCVDGDYDMSIIGHEYNHSIENRMIGGPDSNRTGAQAGAMGEAWSDLAAVEYLAEHGFAPTGGEHPFAVGPYATGNLERGIRNYNMTRNLFPPNATPLPPSSQRLNTTNPLNYSNIGYDLTGVQVHADGEIWTPTNYDIRAALVAKYNASFPASNTTLQRECAEGIRPANLCPGNRRWIQIVFDAYLLMQPAVSMLDARDAYLAADMMRFGGANQRELWRVFARRGMGVGSSSNTNDDPDPVPSFNSPLESAKNVKFRVFAADEGNAAITGAKVFVGHYEARSTAIADTDQATPTPDAARFISGNYDFLVQAPGYGHLRFPRFFTSGGALTLDIFMSTNRASLSKGAVAVGTGTSATNLIDDTEATNWVGATPVAAQQVTVDLQGGVQNVKRVNVSALFEPAPVSPLPVSLGHSRRYNALRQFQILTCNATSPTTPTCSLPIDFTLIYTSPPDAFPGGVPRPVAPDLILRSFDVPDTNATHVRLHVVSSQCTGGPAYQGDQDNDPTNNSDCVTGSAADDEVRASELQVFASTPALPPRDPAVLVTMTAPATAQTGSSIGYQISYTNAGPAESSNARITDVLPEGVEFVSATNGGTYNAATRTVTWDLGTVNVGYSGSVGLTARVTGAAGTVITNRADYTADLTAATPAAAVTTVLP